MPPAILEVPMVPDRLILRVIRPEVINLRAVHGMEFALVEQPIIFYDHKKCVRARDAPAESALPMREIAVLLLGATARLLEGPPNLTLVTPVGPIGVNFHFQMFGHVGQNVFNIFLFVFQGFDKPTAQGFTGLILE
jgi:hypothetical protein